MFERDHTNYFVVKYNIDKSIAGAEHVSLYAEVNDNPEFADLGAYMLNIFLAIKSIASRDFVIGLCFGNKGMDKAEMLAFIDSEIDGQLDSTFHLMVKQMLHRADLEEEYPFIPTE